MKKIGIFIADSNGSYPVPASKGGAVPILVEHLIEINSIKKEADLEVVSFYDKKAYQISSIYKNVKFIWIKVPFILKALDKIIFNFVNFFLKKKKSISYKSLFSLFYYILKSSMILKKNSYDKVVLENNIPLAWIIKISKYTGDYYYHFHNIPRINANCKEVFQNCKGILCVSQYVANQITAPNSPIGPIEKDKTKVLYNCVDTKKFCPINDNMIKKFFREKYHINENDKVIIFVGRLSKEKGIDKLLEAVKLLKDSKIKVLIAGSLIHNSKVKDAYQKKLVELSKDIKEQIIFTGYINQEELVYLYNISNVAVLPSMWDEPAGLTMVEALSCGIPVITMNSGGIPEYVSNCAVVLNKDDDNLVDIIKENIEKILYNNYIDKEKGIKRIKENFDIECYLSNFIKDIS